MAAGPAAVVMAPPAGAPRVGLVASALRPDDGSARWQNGITYQPEGCDSGFIDDPCDSDAKPESTPNAPITWVPYTIGYEYRCSAMAAEGRDWDAIVRRGLESVREFRVSNELWTGDEMGHSPGDLTDGNRFLADVDTVDILTPTPVSVVDGLACLEQYLAETNGGQQGMVHAMAQVVSLWDEAGMLRREGPRVFTVNDSIVVPGRGYTGGDPDGNAPSSGDIWAYATDLVDVRLDTVVVIGSPDDPSFIDRSDNAAVIRAEQLALASWEGCRHAGVRLDVDLCGIGGS